MTDQTLFCSKCGYGGKGFIFTFLNGSLFCHLCFKIVTGVEGRTH